MSNRLRTIEEQFLTAGEQQGLDQKRAECPEREGWVRIEHLRVDAAGNLWIAFENVKQGYAKKLELLHKSPQGMV